MSTMKSRQEAEARSVAEQAAEWLLILEEDREEDREAFADWLKQSPLHVGAFLRARAVDEMLRDVDPDKEIELEAGPLIEEPDISPGERAETGVNVRSLAVAADESTTHRAATNFEGPVGSVTAMEPVALPRRQRPTWSWALAAGVAIALIGAAAAFTARQVSAKNWQHYVTAVGEQRAIQLEDGSVVFLGPDSKVDVRFAAHERQLRLESGQAVFRVHHDATRPFRVHTGRTVVQALGTEFDVHRVRGDAVVSVIEGVVQVTHERTLMQTLASPVTGVKEADLQPIRLTAGQEIRVAQTGKTATPPAPATVDHLQAWKERRLNFVNETLYTIADEFNRYNRTPKLRVEDAAAGEQRYAASFAADEPESLVDVLERNPKLKVERRADEIIIRGQ